MQYHNDPSQQGDKQETGGRHDLLMAGLMVVIFAAFAFVPELNLPGFNAALHAVLDWIRALPREVILIGVPLAVFIGLAIDKAGRAVRLGIVRRGGTK